MFASLVMRRQLLSFKFVQPFTIFPIRQLHQRGYNNWNELMARDWHEINFQLMGAKNTGNIVNVYTKWGHDNMTPEQVMYGFNFIAQNDLERSPDFWNIIVPLVKK